MKFFGVFLLIVFGSFRKLFVNQNQFKHSVSMPHAKRPHRLNRLPENIVLSQVLEHLTCLLSFRYGLKQALSNSTKLLQMYDGSNGTTNYEQNTPQDIVGDQTYSLLFVNQQPHVQATSHFARSVPRRTPNHWMAAQQTRYNKQQSQASAEGQRKVLLNLNIAKPKQMSSFRTEQPLIQQNDDWLAAMYKLSEDFLSQEQAKADAFIRTTVETEQSHAREYHFVNQQWSAQRTISQPQFERSRSSSQKQISNSTSSGSKSDSPRLLASAEEIKTTHVSVLYQSNSQMSNSQSTDEEHDSSASAAETLFQPQEKSEKQNSQTESHYNESVNYAEVPKHVPSNDFPAKDLQLKKSYVYRKASGEVLLPQSSIEDAFSDMYNETSDANIPEESVSEKEVEEIVKIPQPKEVCDCNADLDKHHSREHVIEPVTEPTMATNACHCSSQVISCPCVQEIPPPPCTCPEPASKVTISKPKKQPAPTKPRRKVYHVAHPQHKELKLCVPCKFEPSPLVDRAGKVFCPYNCGCCLCPWRERLTSEQQDMVRHTTVKVCKCDQRNALFDSQNREHKMCGSGSFFDFCPCREKAEAKYLELYGEEMWTIDRKLRSQVFGRQVRMSDVKETHLRSLWQNNIEETFREQ